MRKCKKNSSDGSNGMYSIYDKCLWRKEICRL